MRLHALLGPALFCSALLAACSDTSAGDAVERAKLANDLVQCRNDQSTVKEQIQDLKAEIARRKASADTTLRTVPIDLAARAAPKHFDGNLPADQITKVVSANAATLRVCYEKGLKRNPALQTVSSVKARFSIRNSGKAEGATIAPHVEAEMERCMALAIGKWRFPEFQGDPVAVETPVSLVVK